MACLDHGGCETSEDWLSAPFKPTKGRSLLARVEALDRRSARLWVEQTLSPEWPMDAQPAGLEARISYLGLFAEPSSELEAPPEEATPTPQP